MRKALAILALLLSTLWAAPALAAAPPTLELAGWVRSNTDLPVSQIAITGPDNVYSFEQLGPRLPTGEILALVRTEAVNPNWGDTHPFQSWDAHMLLDCGTGRIRVLRSASYAERDRQGAAKSDERSDSWSTPEAKTPAATLLAAACDPNFSWPLRADPASEPQKATPLGGPSFLQKAAVAFPPVQAGAPAKPAAQVAATPVASRLEKASSVTPASGEFIQRANIPIQQVKFTQAPALETPAATLPQATEAPRRKVLATAKRLADASRTWLVRRAEVTFRRGAPPSQPDARVFQQAAL